MRFIYPVMLVTALLLIAVAEQQHAGALLGIVAAAPLAAPPASATMAAERFGPAVVWEPGMTVLRDIKDKCAAHSGLAINQCFANGMRQAGASAQAVDFARKLGEGGYARDFRSVGPVDIVYVNYPFRANENQGALLVNGSPELINIDDQSQLAQAALEGNPVYGRLAKQSAEVRLWPGERNGTDYLTTKALPNGGQRFVVNYWFRNGCHACAKVGTARFGFDFDQAGRFVGTRLIDVTASN